MQPGLTSPEAGPACLLPMWHLFYPVVTHANTAPEDSAADTMNFLWYLTNSHTGVFYSPEPRRNCRKSVPRHPLYAACMTIRGNGGGVRPAHGYRAANDTG